MTRPGARTLVQTGGQPAVAAILQKSGYTVPPWYLIATKDKDIPPGAERKAGL